LHNYTRLLTNVELFKHLPEIVVIQLIGALRSEIFMPNDVLVKAGTRGDALYFIASGTIAIYDNAGKEVKILKSIQSVLMNVKYIKRNITHSFIKIYNFASPNFNSPLFAQICHLEDGTYFGELALVMEDERKTGSVVAVENCTVYILSRTDFQYALSPYPELLGHLKNIALAHLEQSLEQTSNSSTTDEGISISSMKIRRKN